MTSNRRQRIFYFIITPIAIRPASGTLQQMESQVRKIGRVKGYVRIVDQLPEQEIKHRER